MKTTGRYEIRKVLGEGGMGVVYRAWDPVMKREVTVKTIRNHQDKTALEMFKREVSVLGGMAHPNIVEVYDVGETDESDDNRPYFVMPLLKGTTLDNLIRDSSTRLTPERGVQIIAQVCRGVQAAHESGLIHRDIKPSNIFVLEDDSVKVIDFGVAHLIDQRTVTGLKGTAQYMAPEQLQLKAPTPLADQFSIAVVCYELLSKRHPFKVPGYPDLTQAIIHHIPAAICDINPSVNRLISQVVHKALAKEPVHRFADVREFAESLQKALRNEPIGIFDPSKIEPRLERARKAVGDGDLDFAGEIIREMEAESCLHPDIDALRQTITAAKRRKQVHQLIETARKRFEEEEYLLALQKVQEALNLEADNTELLALSVEIENKRSMAQVEGSLRLAQQHLDNDAYDLARQSAAKVLQLRPRDPRATALLAEAERREQESSRVRQEKEKWYRSALQAIEQGDISGAYSKLERLIDLERSRPDAGSPEQSNTYQQLYEDVRNKHDWLDGQYAEAKRLSGDGNLTAALTICDKVLVQYPNHVVFHGLKYDVEELRRDQISTYIAKVEKDVAAEPDLNRKVSILEQALEKYPAEDRFKQLLDRVRTRRNLVHGIASRAALLENTSQFGEALAQWEILKNTYPQYPGLEIEIERLKARREQQRLGEAKSAWVTQIDRELALHSFARAEALADDALAEYPGDAELLALRKNAQLGLKRIDEAQQKVAEGIALLKEGRQDEGFAVLREALKLDPQSHTARSALMEELLQRARSLIDSDRKAAEALVSEALQLDPGSLLAKTLRTLLNDRLASEEITAARSRAREFQFEGNILRAIEVVDECLDKYPNDEGLAQLRSSLLNNLGEAERAQLRQQDLGKVQQLAERSGEVADSAELQSIFSRTQAYKHAYSGDSDFLNPHTRIERRLQETVALPTRASEAPPIKEPTASQPPPAQAEPAEVSTGASGWRPRVLGVFASVARWLKSLLQAPKPLWRMVGIGGAMVAVTLFIWGMAGGVGTHNDQKKKQPDLIPATGSLLVQIVLDDVPHERVLDENKNDITDRAQKQGLSGGLYYLTGSKPGFRALNQSFTVDPAQGKSLSLSAKWQPLTTVLNIQQRFANPLDKWILDDMPVAPGQLANIEVPRDGLHELILLSQGSHKIRFPFTIADGYPTGSIDLKIDPEIKAMSGVVLSAGHDGARVRGLNVGGVRRVGSAEELDMKAESIPWPATSEVALEAKNGAPLGTVPSHDPADGGLIFVSLFVQTDAKPVDTGTAVQPKPAAPPTISEFRFDPPTVEHGKISVLRWAVANATNVSIDNGIGPVAATGSRPVAKEIGTYTYTVTAGPAARTATLTVSPSQIDVFCGNPDNKKLPMCQKASQ